MDKVSKALQNLDHWVESCYGDWLDKSTNRLRGVVVDSSNFLNNFSLPVKLSRKVSKETFLMICLLSTYLPEDLRAMVLLSLKENVREPSIEVIYGKDARGIDCISFASLGPRVQKVNQITFYFLENVLLTGDYGRQLFAFYLEENGLWRWFYGNIAKEAQPQKVSLIFTSKHQREARRVQRKRGYNDHGSKRDDTKVYPGPDVTTTQNQSILDELQKTYHDELRLRYANLCVRAGVPTQLNLSRKETEELWKLTLKK